MLKKFNNLMQNYEKLREFNTIICNKMKKIIKIYKILCTKNLKISWENIKRNKILGTKICNNLMKFININKILGTKLCKTIKKIISFDKIFRPKNMHSYPRQMKIRKGFKFFLRGFLIMPGKK